MRFRRSSSDAPVRLRTVGMSVSRVGAETTADSEPDEGEEDEPPEMSVFLICAIWALPAAVTAAACIAPIIVPQGNPSYWALMYAAIAPLMVSIVADAMRMPLTLSAAASLSPALAS